jgi:hypothetical protein
MSPEEKEEKRRKRQRRLRLLAILKLVSEGKIDSAKYPIDELFAHEVSPRMQYLSPLERSDYNYGYMTSLEQGPMDAPGYN